MVPIIFPFGLPDVSFSERTVVTTDGVATLSNTYPE